MSEERRKRLDEIIDANEQHPAYGYALCKSFVEDFPESARGWMQYGGALIDLARYEEAKSALEKSIKLCPDGKLDHPYTFMGDLYKFAGDYNSAIEWYKKCIEITPDDSAPYIYIGSILVKSGRLNEAEEYHRKATLCTEGCIDEAYLNLGYVLRAQERYTEALDCFNKALEIDPEYKEAIEGVEDLEKLNELFENS